MQRNPAGGNDESKTTPLSHKIEHTCQAKQRNGCQAGIKKDYDQSTMAWGERRTFNNHASGHPCGLTKNVAQKGRRVGKNLNKENAKMYSRYSTNQSVGPVSKIGTQTSALPKTSFTNNAKKPHPTRLGVKTDTKWENRHLEGEGGERW